MWYLKGFLLCPDSVHFKCHGPYYVFNKSVERFGHLVYVITSNRWLKDISCLWHHEGNVNARGGGAFILIFVLIFQPKKYPHKLAHPVSQYMGVNPPPPRGRSARQKSSSTHDQTYGYQKKNTYITTCKRWMLLLKLQRYYNKIISCFIVLVSRK